MSKNTSEWRQQQLGFSSCNYSDEKILSDIPYCTSTKKYIREPELVPNCLPTSTNSYWYCTTDNLKNQSHAQAPRWDVQRKSKAELPQEFSFGPRFSKFSKHVMITEQNRKWHEFSSTDREHNQTTGEKHRSPPLFHSTILLKRVKAYFHIVPSSITTSVKSIVLQTTQEITIKSTHGQHNDE